MEPIYLRMRHWWQEEYGKNIPYGQIQFDRLNKLLRTTVEDFVKAIFNYEQLQVNLKVPSFRINKPQITEFNGGATTSKWAVDENKHCCYSFSLDFPQSSYQLTVKNIPCYVTNKPIQIFFKVLAEYVTRALVIIAKCYDNQITPSKDAMYIADNFAINIQKTVLIEYLFTVFNEVDERYDYQQWLVPSKLKYHFDLIEKAWQLAHELATSKIENEEVYCGFIFQNDENNVSINSVRSIKLATPIEFGSFAAIKNYLKISNGQDIFFNVKSHKVTEVIITKDKVKDIRSSPLGEEKTFSGRPLIISIQGGGRIFFIEGGYERNALLFQVINHSALIRDGDFIKDLIKNHLSKYVSKGHRQKFNPFIEWILTLGPRRKGTSLIIGKNEDLEPMSSYAVKNFEIKYPETVYLLDENSKFDFELLDHFTLIDGGIILNEYLVPIHVGTIVPNSRQNESSEMGSRHNSIMNFTREKKCLGIVISEDGPITIYENGAHLLRI